MGGFGLALAGFLQPRWKDPVKRRISFYTMPLIFLCFLLPALLAVFGFHLTGYLLAYQMLKTLWLGLAVLIVGGLAFRWLKIDRSHPDTDGGTAAGTQPPSNREDAAGAEVRTRQLVRFIMILIAGIGLFSIWSEALPTLQILKRIQLYPRIVLMEPVADRTTSLTVAQPAPGGGEPAPGPSETTGTGAQQRPTDLLSLGEAGGSTGAPTVLTLWNLLQAILAGLITGMLVKDIPGVLELFLSRRTLLDSGARIALTTLVRYIVLIFGISITFGLLGISWSKVQWLAAALTFGLGFGLQEIVANFVSGIILLLERPVRVGDAVTIEDLQGRVTRTQIRATTITLWDRSEMIVPNKEFITKKLINWTLSDSRRRLDIPIRVAYGTDPEELKRVLLEVARENTEVLTDPAPQALLLAFGDDALKFELRVFVEFGVGLGTRDELQMALVRAFRREGIEFAIPRLSIQVPDKLDSPDNANNPEAPK